MGKMKEEKRSVYQISRIGVIRSCYMEKFGIPRQPGLVDEARAHLYLDEPFNRLEMVKELGNFSHLWVIFVFHETVAEGWKPTVRPPGLGGQQRVGVFASRSPHRPNHLGISAVQLLDIKNDNNNVVLELGGGDFLDDTPVVDIKPYISYSDGVTKATGGYSGIDLVSLGVGFTHEVESFCVKYQKRTGRNLKELISQVLRLDPRPASQRSRKKDFGMRLWDVNIRWYVEEGRVVVIDCKENH